MNIDKLLASISLLLEDYIIPVTQNNPNTRKTNHVESRRNGFKTIDHVLVLKPTFKTKY